VRSVREPVQVYLTGADRALLDRVAARAALSRAEVLRRGVRRMAAEVLGDENPMLKLATELATSAWRARPPRDAAEHHDKYLTEPTPATKKRRKR